MKQYYKVDFDRLIITLLPVLLWRKDIYAVLYSGITSIKRIYTVFCASRDERIRLLSHNGQVCYMRKVLNDTFKTGAVKFDVRDVIREGEWKYAKSEDLNNHLYAFGDGSDGSCILYNEADLKVPQANFIVYVPYYLFDSQLETVKKIVETYKLVSKVPIFIPTSSRKIIYKR